MWTALCPVAVRCLQKKLDPLVERNGLELKIEHVDTEPWLLLEKWTNYY